MAERHSRQNNSGGSSWGRTHRRKPRLDDDAVLVVIAAGGCWCGQEHGHDWPGKALGAPHPSLEEIVTSYVEQKQKRAEERAAVEERLKHGQMKKFKREVREIILRLVNEHEVEYRLQKDGQHIFLYSGARGERPFKIAAARPVTQQMRYLVPWIRENFPDFNVESESSETAYGEHLFDPNDEGKCKVCGLEQDEEGSEHFVDSSPEKAYVEPHPLAEEIEVREVVIEANESDEAVRRVEAEGMVKVPTPEGVRERMAAGLQRSHDVGAAVGAAVDFKRCEKAGEHIVVTRHPESECPYAVEEEEGPLPTAAEEQAYIDAGEPDPGTPEFEALLMTEEERQAQHEAEEEIAGALDTLAGYLGHVVLTQEEWNKYAENRHALDEMQERAERAEKNAAVLRQERNAAEQERDDLKAKLALIREATGL